MHPFLGVDNDFCYIAGKLTPLDSNAAFKKVVEATSNNKSVPEPSVCKMI